MMTLAQAWDEYSKQIAPTEIEGAKRAFYSGALALFNGIIIVIDPDREPTPMDLEIVDTIMGELRDYAGTLVTGEIDA